MSVLLMCGLPASGKTTTAMRLHEALGGRLIRSCDVYADLGIDLPAWVRRTRGFTVESGAYERLRDAAYREMARRLDAALAASDGLVIVDAVHGEADKRRAVYDVCVAHGRAPALLWCRCDDPEERRWRIAKRRGRERQPEHEASDLSVFRHIAALWDDPALDGVPIGEYDTTTRRLHAPRGAPFDVVAGVLSGVEVVR